MVLFSKFAYTSFNTNVNLTQYWTCVENNKRSALKFFLKNANFTEKNVKFTEKMCKIYRKKCKNLQKKSVKKF